MTRNPVLRIGGKGRLTIRTARNEDPKAERVFKSILLRAIPLVFLPVVLAATSWAGAGQASFESENTPVVESDIHSLGAISQPWSFIEDESFGPEEEGAESKDQLIKPKEMENSQASGVGAGVEKS